MDHLKVLCTPVFLIHCPLAPGIASTPGLYRASMHAIRAPCNCSENIAAVVVVGRVRPFSDLHTVCIPCIESTLRRSGE